MEAMEAAQSPLWREKAREPCATAGRLGKCGRQSGDCADSVNALQDAGATADTPAQSVHGRNARGFVSKNLVRLGSSGSLRFLRPRILERDGPVEHELAGLAL